MSPRIAATHPAGLSSSATGVATIAFMLPLGAALGLALSRAPGHSSTLLVAGGLLAFGVSLVVALVAPLALFVTGFVLLAVVLTDPAPVDLVFIILMTVTFAGRRVSPGIPGAVTATLVGLVAVTLLSTVNAQDMTRAVRFESITLYLIALGAWLTWVFRSARPTRLAVTAYIVGAVVSAAVASIARFTHGPGSTVLLFDPYRAKGLFKDPNVFAAFLVPAAAIILEDIARPRLLPWGRKFSLAAFATLSTGSIVAFSRAGWLNLALACTTVLLATAFRRGGLRLAFRAGGTLLVTGLVGLALLASTGSLTFLQQRSHIESYDQTRFATQTAAFSDMTKRVVGHGPGQVEVGLAISTHSVYARSAYEQGVLGLILVSAFFLGTLGFAWELMVKDVAIHGIGSAALFGSWLGLVASGFFIDTLHWRHLWVVAALIWTATVNAPPVLRALPRRAQPGQVR